MSRRALAWFLAIACAAAIPITPAGCRPVSYDTAGVAGSGLTTLNSAAATPTGTSGEDSTADEGEGGASEWPMWPVCIEEHTVATAQSPANSWAYAAPPDGGSATVGFGSVEISVTYGPPDSSLEARIDVLQASVEATTAEGDRIAATRGSSGFLEVAWPAAQAGSLTVTIDAAEIITAAALAGEDRIYQFTLNRATSPTVSVVCLDAPGVGLPYVAPRHIVYVTDGPHRFRFTFSDPMDRGSVETAVRRNAAREFWASAGERAVCSFEWQDDLTLAATIEPAGGRGSLQVCAAGARDAQGRTLWDTDSLPVRWEEPLEVALAETAAGGAQVNRVVCAAPPGVTPYSLSPGGKRILGLEPFLSPSTYSGDYPYGSYFIWVCDLGTGQWRDLAGTGESRGAVWIDDERLLIVGHSESEGCLLHLVTGETTTVKWESPAGSRLFGFPVLNGERVALTASEEPQSAPDSRDGLRLVDVVVCGLDGRELAAYPKLTQHEPAEPSWEMSGGHPSEPVPLAWAPDGTAIVFVHRADRDTLVAARLDLDSGSLQTYPDLGAVLRSRPVVYAPQAEGAGNGTSGVRTYCAVSVIDDTTGRHRYETAVFDLDSGELVFRIPRPGPCLPSPDGSLLAVTAGNRFGSPTSPYTVELYSAVTGQPVTKEPLDGKALAWSPDGVYLFLVRPGQ